MTVIPALLAAIFCSASLVAITGGFERHSGAIHEICQKEKAEQSEHDQDHFPLTFDIHLQVIKKSVIIIKFNK